MFNATGSGVRQQARRLLLLPPAVMNPAVIAAPTAPVATIGGADGLAMVGSDKRLPVRLALRRGKNQIGYGD